MRCAPSSRAARPVRSPSRTNGHTTVHAGELAAGAIDPVSLPVLAL